MLAPEADLALLIDAAKAAGDIAMRHFRAEPEHWKKEGDSPVSIADLEVNAMLGDRLRGARPDYGWLSEESDDDATRLDRERTFIIDPIDGTRAFLDGTTAFAHSLAVEEGGAIVAAVVYLPAQSKLYTAATGQGAALNGASISVAASGAMGRAEILATRPTFKSEHWPGGVPEARRVYRPSLAYRLCLVAEGRFDAMVTFRDAWEWDTAAGALIVAEAGGRVTDGRGAAQGFNSASRLHPGCIAAPPMLHDQLLTRRQAA